MICMVEDVKNDVKDAEEKKDAHKKTSTNSEHGEKEEKKVSRHTDKKEEPKPKKQTKTSTKRHRKKSKRKKQVKVVVVRGKRKEAIARATIKEGKGRVRINSYALDAIDDPILREVIREPILIASDVAPNVDISVNVRGGGPMGQAQAVRNAIALGLYTYTGNEELKARFLERDRFMLIEDSRRVEPKKYLGPKARARKQKSYR